MSTTLSPTRPVCSPTPVNNKEEAELQAFLAVAQREAHEKWEKLRAAKTSGVVETVGGGEGEVMEDAVRKGIEVVSEKEERVVVPKVEPPSKKFVMHMVAIGPRPSQEVILVILIPKKQKAEPVAGESSRKRHKGTSVAIIVNSDSDSLPIPFPNPCKCCVHGDQHSRAALSFESLGSRG
ncbi:hypothetical protein GGU10DRAFT_337072 [Lentinula aff. detonsa]|uniref:Uncharacterized protein n=1 Tax=Lentinula aff. detonsa TaxID=2804958 RepID=A0AA38NJC1_9AGAR|nr:hypothetical protein GGU10DRAFT_337072 [Lentinula aff. detonsa]